ncbi:MAG TPA: alpha/beta-hydrolase family protein [Natronosporangium sp.]
MRERVVRKRLGFGGSVGAVLLFCLSLTPSLLPRHWALQAVVSGITMAIGYGIGASIGAVARRIWPRLPAAPTRAWWILGGVGGLLAAVFLGLGESWQREVRQLVDASPQTGWHPVPIATVAAGVFGLLLLAARGIRLATRRLANTFGRFSPRPVASVAAVGLVATLSYGLGQGVVFNGFIDIAERGAAAANAAIPDGVSRPDSPYVSGGPGSLVPWDTLGAHGREFTAGAVPRAELSAFAGRPARDPIRVYVGRDSAPDLAAQAELAVRELERTGGFDRSVLAVITTTGTGWVNAAVPESLEYMYAGDSAVVAMQYSYLPSWISFMADREMATEAAETLIGAVRERLLQLPADERPKLVVYGESLGAHGTEAAFGDLDELLAETDGALLAGPPHTNPIWREVVSERDPNSPVWQPVYGGGEAVRFAQTAADLSAEDGDPRVVYLQNASDPIVWWSPELLYEKPAWLDGSRGPDVSGAMQWFPVVTFWQVTVDLITSTKAPPGHGHSYHESVADGWAALIAPPGWTDADTARLRPLLTPED